MTRFFDIMKYFLTVLCWCYDVIVDVMAYLLPLWHTFYVTTHCFSIFWCDNVFLASWRTFWHYDLVSILFNVMRYFLMSCHTFDNVTYFPNFLISWHTFWRTFLRFYILFPYFLHACRRHEYFPYFLTSWRASWRYDVHLLLMKYVSTSWDFYVCVMMVFLCNDIPLYLMTYFPYFLLFLYHDILFDAMINFDVMIYFFWYVMYLLERRRHGEDY